MELLSKLPQAIFSDYHIAKVGLNTKFGDWIDVK